MNKIVIGKHTLESLTTGMYADPFVIYREYIQNAVDSIDDAIYDKIISPEEATIDIELCPIDNSVRIIDNGTGIPADSAAKNLISIGNSKKNASKSRGFRGIGRLAGLSYCRRLVFETSYINESVCTKVSIDATKLTELLSITNEEDMTITEVLDNVCSIETTPEKAKSHYFIVTLVGIYDNDLMNYDQVSSFISQTAPVPYNTQTFSWGKEIVRHLQQREYCLPQYRINLLMGSEKIQIFKPYQDTFLIDRSKNVFDSIKDIVIHEVRNTNNDLIAVGWIAKTNYIGSITSKSIKGLRIRKGNILVGDKQTLNFIFKDARFNSWTIGEIFALAPQLLPNARRDNFEKNDTAFFLFESLMPIASNITKQIRSASISRNIELGNVLNKIEKASSDITFSLSQSNTSFQERKDVLEKAALAQKELEVVQVNEDMDSIIQNIAFDEFDMLIGKLQGVTKYKALNSLAALSKVEKKILERVFNTIFSYDENVACDLIDEILNEFSPNMKKESTIIK